MTEPPLPFSRLLSRHTRRREFITLLGGVGAWPLAVGAQNARKRAVPIVGLLDPGSPSNANRRTAVETHLSATSLADAVATQFHRCLKRSTASTVVRWPRRRPAPGRHSVHVCANRLSKERLAIIEKPCVLTN